MQWTPINRLTNTIALLKSTRKFERLDVVNIMDESAFLHLATLIHSLGKNVLDVRFYSCRIDEQTLGEIFKYLPAVKRIHFISGSLREFYDYYEPPVFENLEELLFFNVFHKPGRVFSRAEKICKLETDEETLHLLAGNTNLSSLQQLVVTIVDYEDVDGMEQFRDLFPMKLQCRLQKLAIIGSIEMKNLTRFLSNQIDLRKLTIKNCISTDLTCMKLVMSLKNLKEFTIWLSDSLPIDERIFYLQNLSVQHLKVEIPDVDEWNQSYLEQFIHLFPNLTSLKLKPTSTNEKFQKNFFFENLKKLEEVSMEFYSKEPVLAVSQPKLSKLKVDIVDLPIEDWEKFFKNNPNIKHLEIFIDPSMYEVIGFCTQSLKLLESLTIGSLHLHSQHLHQIYLRKILTECEKLKKLQIHSLEGVKEDYQELFKTFDHKLSSMYYDFSYYPSGKN